jgi:pyruvate,water dikinase
MTTTMSIESSSEETKSRPGARKRRIWSSVRSWPGVEPRPLKVEVPAGFWQREASHSPLPYSPMSLSLWSDRRDRVFAAVFERYGVLADGVQTKQIGGWEYSGLVPLGGKEPPALPAWLTKVVLKVHPVMRARIAQTKRVFRDNLAEEVFHTWKQQWRPQIKADIDALADIKLSSLTDAELIAHTRKAYDLFERGAEAHFQLHGALGLAQGSLAFAARDLLGWDDLKTFDLVAGLSDKSTEPAMRLSELAKVATGRPAVLALVRQADVEAAGRLREVDPDFASRFETYQREFGLRALRYEVADPALAEAPEITLATIRDQIATGYDASVAADALSKRRAEALQEARALLQSRTLAERERFESALRQAEASYGIREDNEFYTISAPLALIRYTVLEVGRRLAAAGQIDEPDDVFFLEYEEALSTLTSGAKQQSLVVQRKAERAWIFAHEGPETYGTPPAPPSLDVLPPESRFVMEVVIWYTDSIFAQDASSRMTPAEAPSIDGIAAAPGVYRGPARVIMGEHEFDKIQAGDVLVCPVTSPVWSVLFGRVGALITDKGGILSHPAIIAREYHVPAVVGTGNATSLLRDGQLVEVDGSNGVVRIV